MSVFKEHAAEVSRLRIKSALNELALTILRPIEKRLVDTKRKKQAEWRNPAWMADEKDAE